MHDVFAEWNKGELDSFLIEITAEIFAKKDEDGKPMVDKILDTAGQKGTGKWTGISALDLGMPVTLIGEAVFARCLSAMKDERVAASKVLHGPEARRDRRSQGVHRRRAARAVLLEDHLLRAGLHAAARGGEGAGLESELRRHRADVARRLHHPQPLPGQDQGSVRQESEADQSAAGRFLQQAAERIPGRRGATAIIKAIEFGVPTPAFSTALSFFDGYRTERLPANLLQAQRDFFGAHTYERVDKPRGEFFHTNWTGRGGRVSSGTYNA